MTAREKMLLRLKEATRNAEAPPLPVVSHIRCAEPLEIFMTAITSVGGVAKLVNRHDLDATINNLFPGISKVVSGVDDVGNTYAWSMSNSPGDLQLAILNGHFGVAENAAIWISDKVLPDRAIPFICEHLVLVLDKNNVVSNMAEAYDLLENSGHQFGTFISGPSKTADIEQSLVLGAHGAKTLTVLITQ